MKTQHEPSDDTDRIDPRELADQSAEVAAYHVTAATEEHRPIGVVVISRPPPAAEPTPACPWWKFWAR